MQKLKVEDGKLVVYTDNAKYVDGDIYVEKLHFISKIGDEWFKSKELEEIALDRKYLK